MSDTTSVQSDVPALQSDIFFLGIESADDDVGFCNAAHLTGLSENLSSTTDGGSEFSLKRILVSATHDVTDWCVPNSGDEQPVEAAAMNVIMHEQDHFERDVETFVRLQHHQLQSYQSAVKASLLQQRRQIEQLIGSSRVTSNSLAPHDLERDTQQWRDPDETQEVDTSQRPSCHHSSKRTLRSIFDGLTPSTGRASQSIKQGAQTVGRAYRATMMCTEPEVSCNSPLILTLWRHREVVRRWRLCHFNWLERWVEFDSFHCVVCAVIALNSLYIGVSSHFNVQRALESYDARLWSSGQDPALDTSVLTRGLDAIFNAFFAGELLVRILAHQGAFLVGEEWRWNVFDTVVLMASFGNMFLLNLGYGADYARLIGLARVGRSLSVFRMVRFSRIFSKIKLLTLAVAHCGTMLLWAVLYLVMVLFFFAVIFLNAFSTHLNEGSPSAVDSNMDNLRLYFGSLPMTMLTLFMVVSGGVDWWEILQALLSISILYASVYLVFMSLTTLAILNVINAIFVNDAMEMASMDLDLRLKAEVARTRLMVQTLTDIFNEMSVRGDGVAPHEFATQMEREDMKLFCSSIGLFVTDYDALFKLLDVDDNGVLCVDEFVIGFLRLRGGSMMIDVGVSMQEMKVLIRKAMVETWNAVQEIGEDVQNLRQHVALP